MCPFGINRPLLPRHRRLPLQMHVHALGLRLSHLGRILFDSVQKLLATAGEGDVLDADVDALFDVAVADALVDDDADGGFRDVVDDAGFAMVDFVGHAVGSLRIIGFRYEIDGPCCMETIV